MNRISNISYRALSLAAALPMVDSAKMARWLYRYGSYPRALSFERDYGPGDDPMAILSLVQGGVARRKLETVFEPTTHHGWFSFTPQSEPAITHASCKLYVSPSPEVLAMAFPIIAEIFVELGVRSFKVGRGIEGLLRPDKIVAYFNNRSELWYAVRKLRHSLIGCPAQPVPFTAEAGLDGLLSWGIDPQPKKDVLSWRSWITRLLAKELANAQSSSNENVVENALCQIQAKGVNTSAWTVEDCNVFDEEPI